MKSLVFLLIVSLVLLTACAASQTIPADEAKTHLEQGNLYLKQEAWDKAIVEFDKAKDLNPELEPEALVGRGTANAWAGDYQQAEDDFNTVIDMSYGKYTLITADVYVAWGIALAGLHKSYEAESFFVDAISRDPNSADAYSGRALMRLRQATADVIKAESIGFHKLGDAISDFEKSIKLDPRGIQGRIERFSFEGDMAFLPNYIKANKKYGAVLVSTNIYTSNGFEEYDRVLKVAPDDVEALVGRGIAYMKLQQYNLALLDFGKAIELAPSNAHAYAGRAIAYSKKKQYELAITDFERAILLDDGYGLGEYYDAYATPNEYFEQNVIGFASSYIDVYSSRGYELLELKEFISAIIDFTKAIEFQADKNDANHPELDVSSAFAGRGIAYVRIGSYQQALDDFTIANYGERFEMFTEAYIARAIAYSRTGRYFQALEDFRHAEVYTNFSMDADAYLARGIAYYWEGEENYYLADNDFLKVIDLAPNSSQAVEAQQYHTKIKQGGKLR